MWSGVVITGEFLAPQSLQSVPKGQAYTPSLVEPGLIHHIRSLQTPLWM